MSISTLFVEIWIICSSCKSKGNFLIFWCLYYLLFDICILLGLVKSLMANIWENTKSFWSGNLNSGLSYLITTVNTMHFHFLNWALAGYYCHLDAKNGYFWVLYYWLGDIQEQAWLTLQLYNVSMMHKKLNQI